MLCFWFISGSCGVLILNEECYYFMTGTSAASPQKGTKSDPKVNHLTRNLLASLRWIFFFFPSKDIRRKCISIIGKELVYSRFFFTVILTSRKLPHEVWQSKDE